MAKAKTKPEQEAQDFAAALRGVILNLPPLLNDGEAHREKLVALLTKKMEG